MVEAVLVGKLMALVVLSIALTIILIKHRKNQNYGNRSYVKLYAPSEETLSSKIKRNIQEVEQSNERGYETNEVKTERLFQPAQAKRTVDLSVFESLKTPALPIKDPNKFYERETKTIFPAPTTNREISAQEAFNLSMGYTPSKPEIKTTPTYYSSPEPVKTNTPSTFGVPSSQNIGLTEKKEEKEWQPMGLFMNRINKPEEE